MNFLADVYLIPAKRERSTPLISESDFDLASKLGTKHYVPKILKKVKFAGGGGGDADVGEAADAGDDGGDGYNAGDPPGPNTPVAGRSRAPTAAADAETTAPAPRARSHSRLRQSSTAPPPAQQPPPADAAPPPRSRSKSKGPVAKASGSITGLHLRQNFGAAAAAVMRGASGAAAVVARGFPRPTKSSADMMSPSGGSHMGAQRQRGRSPTPKPRNVIFMPGSTPQAAARAQSRGKSRAASAASNRGDDNPKGKRQSPPHSPVPAEKQERKSKPAEELEIHAMKPPKEATPPIKARLRRSQSQAPPKAAAAAAPPMSLYGTLKGQNVIMGARGGLTVETATGGFRALSKAEKEQIVKKTA